MERPGRLHLHQIIKVNITGNQICWLHVPPDVIHQECSITSVVSLPKMHSPNFIMGKTRQTLLEGQSTKEMANTFQKHQRQR